MKKNYRLICLLVLLVSLGMAARSAWACIRVTCDIVCKNGDGSVAGRASCARGTSTSIFGASCFVYTDGGATFRFCEASCTGKTPSSDSCTFIP